MRRRFRDAIDLRTRARLVPAAAADLLLGATAYDLAYALAPIDAIEAVACFERAVAFDPSIRTDERGARFRRKCARVRWTSSPDLDALPSLSTLGTVVAATWALIALGVYVAVRVAARHVGGS